MDNYAESLTYWYLRLNGFFPMSRFVLHGRPGDDPSDTDLLAVRFGGVYERIGGQQIDWHRELFEAIGADPRYDTVALIVEVKGGFNTAANAGAAFDMNHVVDGIHRIGTMCTGFDSQAAIQDLIESQGHVVVVPVPEGQQARKVVVAKLLVANKFTGLHGGVFSTTGTCHRLLLDDMRRFIQHRIRTNLEKLSDWTFFPSDLFQFLLWQERDYLPVAD